MRILQVILDLKRSQYSIVAWQYKRPSVRLVAYIKLHLIIFLVVLFLLLRMLVEVQFFPYCQGFCFSGAVILFSISYSLGEKR